MKLTCPHCGLQAMSALKKLSLGWSRSVPCRACGLFVTVSPGPAVLSMLPCLVVVAAAVMRWIRDPVTLALVGVGAIAINVVLHLWWVPLTLAQLTDREAVRRAQERQQ